VGEAVTEAQQYRQPVIPDAIDTLSLRRRLAAVAAVPRSPILFLPERIRHTGIARALNNPVLCSNLPAILDLDAGQAGMPFNP
jgi:hypothetical protein